MERLANKKGIEKLWSSHTLHYLDFIGNEHKKTIKKVNLVFCKKHENWILKTLKLNLKLTLFIFWFLVFSNLRLTVLIAPL